MFTKLISIFLVLFLLGCPGLTTKKDEKIYKWGELPSLSGGKYNVCKREGSSEMFKCPDYMQD